MEYYALSNIAEKIDERQEELARLAQKRYARRGFERCNALLYASELLGQWFDSTTTQRKALEADLQSTIETQALMGSHRLALRFKLARREINRFSTLMQKELGFSDLVRRCKREEYCAARPEILKL